MLIYLVIFVPYGKKCNAAILKSKRCGKATMFGREGTLTLYQFDISSNEQTKEYLKSWAEKTTFHLHRKTLKANTNSPETGF